MVTVDVVVLTYKPELSLEKCVESALEAGAGRVVVAVNNVAEEVAPAMGPVVAKWGGRPVEVLPLGRNWGYAEGLNRALEKVLGAPGAPFLLLLNDDAWVAPGALDEMARVLDDAGSRTAGVAPKVLLGGSDRIDCVGAGILADGWVANRGYGDADQGQYDRIEEVAGACFAAVLLRREALLEVGPLWSPFFMYAEDADWCLRARLAGWRFVTCPTAVVRHQHSLSTATLPPAWKVRQIRRNSMLVVVRGFPPRRALALSLAHLWQDLRGWPAQPGQKVRVSPSFLRLLPAALAERRRVRGLVRRSPVDRLLFDERVVALARRPPVSALR